MWEKLVRVFEGFRVKRNTWFWFRRLSGEISPKGSLVAVKQMPRPIKPLEILAVDALTPGDSMIAAGASESQTESVRLAHSWIPHESERRTSPC